MVILGAGESGTGAALLGAAHGYTVFVSDRGAIAPSYQAELEKAGIAFEQGSHNEHMVLSADWVVKSPGIPDTAPLVQKLKAKGTPVISEIEFAGRFMEPEAKKILITGTNGKTTTALLTYHILKLAGKKVALGGNVGYGLSRLVLKGGYDMYVIEVSSFQLDGMMDFHANLATVLNISPDHLDRYAYSMERYTDSKFRVLQNMTSEDEFVYVMEDPMVATEVAKRNPAPRLHVVTRQEEEDSDAALMGETVVIRSPNRSCEWYYSTENISIKGPHNELNAMVASTLVKLLGLSEEEIRAGLSSFQNVAHRMELVGEIQGVRFVNDSKATNVDAAKQSLGSYGDTSLVWVAGGIDKGNDYNQLKPLVRDHVKAVVCLGMDNTALINLALELSLPVFEAKTATEAAKLAFEQAQYGDLVLLAPACSSFDLFKNFEHRGDAFREAVADLKNVIEHG